VAWTDHRLRKYPEASDSTANPNETLVPIFSPGTTKRDVALAYYKALLEGNFALQQKAYEELEAIKPELSGDKDALAALGILSEERGDYKQAQELFQEVLKLDPRNLIAISNLGTLLAKSGDLQGAISILRPAFERNEDVAGLAKNLAQVEMHSRRYGLGPRYSPEDAPIQPVTSRRAPHADALACLQHTKRIERRAARLAQRYCKTLSSLSRSRSSPR
jgi:tetratricopeptide (TPR) repeat protein